MWEEFEMKRIFSLLLCVILIFIGIPFVASAETVDTVDIKISWDDMYFVYSPTWDAMKLEYVDSPVDGWSAVGDANKITINNNTSDKAVSVYFSCDDMSDGVTAFSFYNADMTPISGGFVSIDPTESHTVKVFPVGVLSKDVVTKSRIGSIVLTISVNK